MVLKVGEQYLVEDDFTAEAEGELTVHCGNKVTILEPEDPSNPGWVFVQLAEKEGYVPSDFLAPDNSAPPAHGHHGPPPAAYGTQPPPAAYGAQPPPAAYSAPPPAASYSAPPSSSYGTQPPPAATGAPPPAAYGTQPPPAAYGAPPPPAAYGAPPPPSAYGAPSPYGGAPPPAYGAPSSSTLTQRNSQDSAGGSSRSGLFDPVPARPAYDQEEAKRKFQAEQRVISIELWEYREELLGSVGVPNPPRRNWYYRDYFEDLQGPFDGPEMRERLGKKYINDNSKVVLDIGYGDCTEQIEEVLRTIFRSPEAAFMENPRPTKVGGYTWYFMNTHGKELGPFSNAQMKLWYDSGYFGGGSLVRLANGKTQVRPLKDIYADPDNAFHAPPNLPGYEPSRFTGVTSAVLLAPKNRQRLDSVPDPGEEEEHDEKVEIGEVEGPPPPPRTDGAKLEEGQIVYGAGWPEFQGVPSPHSLKPAVYSAALYTFLTRPLHPEAGTVQCYIRRDIDGSHINFNKYVLFLEETNTPVVAAFRHHHTLHNYYDIKMNTTGRLTDNAKGLTISNLELNFIGTTFLLHNSVAGHQGTAKDLATVVYERNRVSNKGPRKMKVGVPSLRDDRPEFVEWKHEGVKNSQMAQALKAVTTKDLIPLLNKPPRWNEKKRAYMLDFKGRVTRSSVKNFQLVDAMRDPDHKSVLLQHGRVGVNKFTMDVKHPLSILQAFAICLSSLHSKKGVD